MDRSHQRRLEAEEYDIVDETGEEEGEVWRLSVLPPCSADVKEDFESKQSRLPTRWEGVVHLITFKGTLSSYIVGSTAVGYYMAPGPFSWRTFLLACGGTALTVLSANAFNQVIESESDSRMHRTSQRYLPSGGCHTTAVTFAVVTGLAGGVILWRHINKVSALLAVGNIALYAAVYTPLKQMHWSNTWVGSVVGAIPPMIGWAAKTGHLECGSWVLGGLLFFWQMPHFMAIAWKNQDDYERGGYKMLVNTHREQVPGVALRYSLPLLFLGPLSYAAGMTSKWFIVTSMIPSAFAVGAAIPFFMQPSVHNARRLFFSSLVTLPVFCSLLVLQRADNPTVLQHYSELASGLFASLSDNVRSFAGGIPLSVFGKD